MAFGRPLRVPYNIPGSQNWQWVNIFTRLAQERIIFINQPLTMGLSNEVISYMLFLDSQDQKPIYVYINSIGDPIDAGMADITAGMMSVTAGLAIYDTMKNIKSEVLTIGMGQVVGMAALLLAAGTKGKRACLPHTSLVLTQPQMGAQGQATDIEVSSAQMKLKRQLVVDLFAEHTGQTAEKIFGDLDRTFYMGATDAQAYGLIDRVVQSMKDPAAPALAGSNL
ncbi:ATP-dependent Clp protease proteolytic subunit [filamentous cyanobacterium LEGE 11480]|uniref:ATP-dependent Clp protease proteolytic subunit n=1 Tax=Romeriopsis navalis LEGE 11480 TaxID=2777977 RepID=A0A928VKW2_9CYAN|nr:ATP-dependent Clp protease proteolytic subunit [Romeriopsis navalis]MBE9029517.1 ATP-dependent Clp protease proteolytic subunit [Romeriopsis navalis LEGE 11480]